jgi:DNA-binding MarR family transcriptional regulator
MANLLAAGDLPSSPEEADLVPLARSLGYHVRHLAETWQGAMDRRAEEHGLTVSQWRYLRELWEEDGLSTGELTQRVGRQGPTTVAAVQLLERAGLVTVTKSNEDRRKSFIYLTRRGQRLASTMSPIIAAVNAEATADLTGEQLLAFKRLIVRIQRTLDAKAGNRHGWAARRTRRLAEEVGL